MVSGADGSVFAGTLGGGVFRSSDNGATWMVKNNGLTATDVRALAVNPAGDIFAGTFGRHLSLAGWWRNLDGGK